MASLEQVLASIPGLAGYQAQVNQNNATTMGNVQQGQAVGGILAQIQKQAVERQAMQRDAQYRQQLAGATTDEERALIAMQAEGPKGVLQHLDRKTQQQATKEATLARLQQQATQFEQGYQIRLKQATTAEERANLDAQYKQAKLALDTAAQRMTGERLFYDTGMRVATPAAPALTPAAPTPMVQGQAPNEAAAIAAIQAGGGRPMSIEIPTQAAAAPAAPVSAPPVLPPTPAPQNNMDARDLRLQGGAPVSAPVAAPVATAPEAPAMPNFTGSPRQIAEAKNKWLAAQGKGGEGGGKAGDNVVQAIVDGRMAMPTGFALRSPYWQDVIERVAKQDPNFDAGKYGARAAARRTFASGPEARNVTALNTVIGHLGTLDEAATALSNGDIRLFNSVANRLATETGDPRVQNFDTAKQAVAEETMRVFRQVGASESEARMWGERITASGSPKQLKGVIATLGTLLDSRVEAIGQQYERTVNGGGGNPASVDPKNRVTLDRLKASGTTGFSDADKERRYQEWKAKQK